MALHPCYECGKEISTVAEACPHCGAPAGAKAGLKKCKSFFCSKPATNENGLCVSCNKEDRKIKKWGILFAGMMLLWAISSFGPEEKPVSQNASRESGGLNYGVVACRSQAASDELFEAATRSGDAAYQNRARQLVNSGKCRQFSAGSKCDSADYNAFGSDKVYIGDQGPWYVRSAVDAGCRTR